MSRIKNLMAIDRVVEVEYEDVEGFFVNLRYITRDELTKVRSRNLQTKWNKITHQRDETVDNDSFIKDYTKKVIVGWRGLTVGGLSKLLPVELPEDVDLEEEIPYSDEEALDLITNSTVFDRFITDAMDNLETFEQQDREEAEKN